MAVRIAVFKVAWEDGAYLQLVCEDALEDGPSVSVEEVVG